MMRVESQLYLEALDSAIMEVPVNLSVYQNLCSSNCSCLGVFRSQSSGSCYMITNYLGSMLNTQVYWYVMTIGLDHIHRTKGWTSVFFSDSDAIINSYDDCPGCKYNLFEEKKKVEQS
ncbi:G-type lectin S-receptor-like serine/threonine-protein kinase-like [Dorcoceras hygrometricum]|nr:G-type lectin S-receptor-like serine/threonine-protein kinase-like [Dorcoceras hygrometricum]